MKYFALLSVIIIFFFAACSNQNTSKDNFNIVLITIDALRADHLSCYGYYRNTSPNIDKIAEKGIIFKNVIAPSSWTVPSMVSLFTSVYPINHGIVKGFVKEQKIHNQNVFSDDLITLAELLKANGYNTFGVASNLHLGEKLGFARGFDYFKCLPFTSAPWVNKIIYSWESEINKSDKFFLWIHYFDPHLPYRSQKPWTEEYSSREITEKYELYNKNLSELNELISILQHDRAALSNLIALYDSDINYVDFYIGNLINKFKLDENTLIIITADHGEEFLDHGMLDHGNNLHSETINVPFIVKFPYNNRNGVIDQQISTLDIMPTIIDILNINPLEQMLGKSALKKKGLLFWLMKLLINKERDESEFTELDKKSVLKAILTPEWKYIYNYKDKTQQLYNIKSDPEELDNLADKKAKQCNQLKKQLLNWVATSKTYPVKKQSFELSQEEKEKLKAMGYVGTEEDEDYDKDGIFHEEDNCPHIYNPDQEDTNGDRRGDACEASRLEYHWLEAEYADTLTNPLVADTDDNASKGGFIYAPNGTGNEYTLGGSTIATYTVNIAQEGVYILWGRVQAHDRKDNSFFVQIDDNLDNLWEVETGNYWLWDKVNARDIFDPVGFNLKSGIHTIKIKLREDGTKLDKILLTNNLDFVPSG